MSRLGFGLLLLVALFADGAARAAEPPRQKDELQLVVALYRHGVRAPLDGFTTALASAHSGKLWPHLEDWKMIPPHDSWGDLTRRGTMLAEEMGRFHAARYEKEWGSNFKVFLWADVDRRTIDTANALRGGFRGKGVNDVTVDSRAKGGVDPLFHPFKANCGTPESGELNRVVDDINKNWSSWAQTELGTEFKELYRVLDCPATGPCTPLDRVRDHAEAWRAGETRGTSPIEWRGNESSDGKPPFAGRFPYASSASEAFVLEYANGMTVGWGKASAGELPVMLRLHEFYFKKTERDRYLAGLQGSNLIREIRQDINGATGACSRIPLGVQFAGLVGHDTNLANVGARLNFTWKFKNAPDQITKEVPANDALPAGTLLFERWKRAGGEVVTIWYSALSLEDMSRCTPEKCPGFVVPVEHAACQGLPTRCDIPLEKFNEILAGAIDARYVSVCDQHDQVCR